jgi:hypothetical protein
VPTGHFLAPGSFSTVPSVSQKKPAGHKPHSEEAPLQRFNIFAANFKNQRLIII